MLPHVLAATGRVDAASTPAGLEQTAWLTPGGPRSLAAQRYPGKNVEQVVSGLDDERSRVAFRWTFEGNVGATLRSYIGQLVLHHQYMDYVDYRAVRMGMNLDVDMGKELPGIALVLPLDAWLLNVDPQGREALAPDVAGLLGKDPRFLFETAAADQEDGYVELSGNAASTVTRHSSASETSIPAYTLATLMARHGFERLDILKTDIEGAEGEILDYMVSVARRYRPQLAVSIYHTLEQFVEIPLRLMSELNDYRFFFVKYSPFQADGILYAIPVEIEPHPFGDPYRPVD